MARDDSHFRLRIPDDVKTWVAAQASRNLRSMTAEIVLTLRERMAATEGSFADGPSVAAQRTTAQQGGVPSPKAYQEP